MPMIKIKRILCNEQDQFFILWIFSRISFFKTLYLLRERDLFQLTDSILILFVYIIVLENIAWKNINGISFKNAFLSLVYINPKKIDGSQQKVLNW